VKDWSKLLHGLADLTAREEYTKIIKEYTSHCSNSNIDNGSDNMNIGLRSNTDTVVAVGVYMSSVS
jgi:hypothetical protein